VIEVGDKTQAGIRSLGAPEWRMFWVRNFGQTVLSETVDGFSVRYVKWRGVLYTLVTKEPSE
jgi:hypothetical protein